MNIDNIEYIGAKIFLDAIESSGQVWFARGEYQNIYTQELFIEELGRAGLSLPVWSSQDKATAFLSNARLVGQKYIPEAVPTPVFTRSWLSNKSMDIAELQVNPDGRSARVLILTTEEFIESQATTGQPLNPGPGWSS